MEEANPELDALAMSEDISGYGFEKFMPWARKPAGNLHVSEFKQILTYSDQQKLTSPDEALLDKWTRELLESPAADAFDHMPSGCLTSNKGTGSSFPVSCLFTQVSKPYGWWLSAGHVSSRQDEMVKAGRFSNFLFPGVYVNDKAGMAYDIMLHGRAPADRVRYSGVDPAVHSPPSKMRTYHKPSEGALYANGVDAMLLKVYYEDGKYNKMDLERNWFYTPSGGRSEEFVEELPICVVGTPGPVDEDIVTATLGQHIKQDDRSHIVSTLNNRMMVPHRRGLSFGEIVTTNGRQVKHTASTNHGTSGGVGANRAYPGLFEFIHIAGERDAQDRLFNRGVSKDDPWLVCALAEMVVPDLALCNSWRAGQKESLVTWLSNNKMVLQKAGLWGNVKKAGFV